MDQKLKAAIVSKSQVNKFSQIFFAFVGPTQA
jgi:hypothetical protein